jgi:hypothetical protein
MHPAPERMFCAHELTYAYWCPQGAYGDVTCSYRRDSRGHDASAWNGVDYLQALYADGLRGHFDAVGWHPYNYWNHATAVQMLAYHRCSAWTQLASTRVSVRSLMAGHADGRKRIWITRDRRAHLRSRCYLRLRHARPAGPARRQRGAAMAPAELGRRLLLVRHPRRPRSIPRRGAALRHRVMARLSQARLRSSLPHRAADRT